MSTRNGGWVSGRLSNGTPSDIVALSKFVSVLFKACPNLIQKLIAKRLNANLDHEKYGLCPKYSPMRSNFVVSDEITFKLITGKIKMKPQIKQVRKTDVIFDDDSVAENIDAIIYATGYIQEYPFLSKDIVDEDKEQLYLTMFPRHRNTSTLAVMGNIRVKGAALPVLEMQARYAMGVFKVSQLAR